MGRVTDRRRVTRVDLAAAATPLARPDVVAVEEPLEIRIDGRPLAVTMRTPGDDVDLAIGFLITEGLVTSGDDIATARFCAGSDDDGVNSFNILELTVADGVTLPHAAARQFYMASSCGVCGKASIDAVRTSSRYDVSSDDLRVSASAVVSLPDTLRQHQRAFDKTGGVHAAGVFDAQGQLLCLREDVGRHNAVDKVVGWAAREAALPLRGTVLHVSGRASFELVQKAIMAGIPMLAAVSAPSSLAVDLAQEAGLTLVGFLRGQSFNIYSGAERIT